MSSSPLITTEELQNQIDLPDLRIVDCRFNLAEPEWGYDGYLEGHIPGAVYAHLDNDLAAPIRPNSGRHPLPDPKMFTATLSRWGITSQTRVVVYDTVGGGFASRLWFMLRAIGHRPVQLLDGGFPKWIHEQRPVQQGNVKVSPASYPDRNGFDAGLLADTSTVQAASKDPESIIIDARAPERYQGLNEPIDPVAGHIPGAVNRFHAANLTPGGVFKPPQVLQEEFQALLAGRSGQQALVYCGSGVTSCHHLVAMEVAGILGARLYAGSWSEWIRDPNRPVATGNSPSE